MAIGHISYPEKRFAHRATFRLNSDDFSAEMIRRISAYFKKIGLNYKYHRIYSDVKLMSWGVYAVDMKRNIDWEQNQFYAESFVKEALEGDIPNFRKDFLSSGE